MTRICAAMSDSLVVADGSTTRVRLTDRGRLESVAVDDRRPDRVFAGTFGDGLWRSTDGGDTFERVGREVLASSATSVAVDPHDPDRVWAGTEPSRLYCSTDGGATWETRPGLADLPSASEWSFPPRPDTHHVRWIEPDPHHEERLYLAIEAGALVRTDDGGRTYRDRPADARRDNHTIATHHDAPGRVYVAAGDGYAESEDGGDSWHYPQESLAHRYVWGLAVDPGDPDRVMASATTGARRAHTADQADARVYRRTGGPWEELESLPTGEGVTRAVFDATAPGTVYAAHNRGLFRSTDWGGTVERIDDRFGLEWRDRFGTATCRGLAVVDDDR